MYSSDPCYAPWSFVTCNGGAVVAISLNANTLSQAGIPTHLGQLTSLTSLSVSFNKLTGAIPSELGLLTGLTSLSLSYNSLTGSIPSVLGLLTALKDIDVCYNSLSNSIPSSLGALTELTRLSACTNLLTSIFTELGALTRLRSLELQSNSMRGSIPTHLGLLAPALQTLMLGGNRFSGQLPTHLGALTSLTTFYVDQNPCLYGPLVNFTQPLGTAYSIYYSGLATWAVDASCGLTLPAWSNPNDTAAMLAVRSAWCASRAGGQLSIHFNRMCPQVPTFGPRPGPGRVFGRSDGAAPSPYRGWQRGHGGMAGC